MKLKRGEDLQLSKVPGTERLTPEELCLLQKLAQAIGPEIFESLVKFILAPQAGSRLSLQRNQNEFTCQLTGPVARSSSSLVDRSDFQDLFRKFTLAN